MKAVLLFYQKLSFKERYVMEMAIHEIDDSIRYPDNIRYGLFLMDFRTGKRVLMDNHYPKGHHYHLDDAEFPYEYRTNHQLVEDFKSLALEHLGVSL